MLHRLTRVDIRDWQSGDPARRAAFVDAVRTSLVREGFLLVYGFDGRLQRLHDNHERAAKRVFAYSDADLKRYERFLNQRGFAPTGTETSVKNKRRVPDCKRFWMTRLGERPKLKSDCPYGRNVWPQEVPAFRRHTVPYLKLLVEIGRAVLGALDLSYGFADGKLCEMTYGSETMLRSIHYPPINWDTVREGEMRSFPHEDINLITVMVAVFGLQLFLQDEWVDVESPPDTAIVNVGEMIAKVAGILDLVPMTHRVQNPPRGDDSERFSYPAFVHARHSVELQDGLLAGDWLKERIAQITAPAAA